MLDDKYNEVLGDNCGLHLLIIYDNKNCIRVIDNQFHWEVKDFDCVTERMFYDLDEAIFVAKKLAERHRLTYAPFESRYCSFREVCSSYNSIAEEEIDEIAEEYLL